MVEQILVGLIVVAALAFVGRRVWRTAAAFRSKPGCGDDGCGGCGH